MLEHLIAVEALVMEREGEETRPGSGGKTQKPPR
jgi:hypothetical protein